MDSTIRIATIDGHPIFLAGLKQSLQRAKDIKVVAEGHCAADARKIAREDSPDIMLLDVGIEGGGIQAAGAILAENAAAKIVMLTADDDEHTVASAIQTGVRGYLLKGHPRRRFGGGAARCVQGCSPHDSIGIRAALPAQCAVPGSAVSRTGARHEGCVNASRATGSRSSQPGIDEPGNRGSAQSVDANDKELHVPYF